MVRIGLLMIGLVARIDENQAGIRCDPHFVVFSTPEPVKNQMMPLYRSGRASSGRARRPPRVGWSSRSRPVRQYPTPDR
jgi:hypothetical protein